jgi:CHAT domain-containing protein
MNLGDYGAAKPLFEDSLRIRVTLLGPEHPDVAQQCLNNLGRLHLLTGDKAAAEGFYRRSLAIQEKVLDAWHPHLAETLQGLAEVLKSSGDLAGAEPLYRRAASIEEKARGPGHPYVGETLEGLAEVLARSGRDGEALQVALRAEEITREHLRLTALTLPERQALRYAARRNSGLGTALSLLSVESDPAVVRQVWDAIIRSRAVVLDEIASRSRSQIHSENPEMNRLYQALASARAKLAHLVIQGDPAQDREEFLRRVEESRRGQENAERALAETSADFRRRRLGASIGFREVRDSLPERSALIAFVRYDRLPRPSAERGAPGPGVSVPSYAAFVLDEGSADPRVVPLGSADRIDALIRAWRSEASVAPPAVRAAALRSETRCRVAGERLRRAIWDPIATLVPGARNLLVVPDALLSLVNLAALPAGADRYLAEETFTLHYLSAERDLVPTGPRPVPAVGLLAIGAPTYDAPARATQQEKPAASRGGSSPCLQFRKTTFAPLPGALKEVGSIEALWSKTVGMEQAGSSAQAESRTSRPAKVVRLTGSRATEEAVKRLAGQAQVLHLATHGIFVSDCSPSLGETGAAENPFLLSGLALAGANRRLLAKDEEEDGILTAGEIASLDLGAVDWAVLSGCDTGVGRVLAGEGVLGLRRAFQIAGARTLIMSLWPVDDSATRFWMNELYRRHLNGESTADAVRAADLGALTHRRQSGWSTHPYYWSAFVASGDWR